MTRVTVQFVNPVAAGKREGSIKLSDGSYLGVKPDMLSQFQQGGTYDVEWSSRHWNGKEYRTVTKAALVSAPTTNGSAGSHGAVSDKTAKRIYICGLLNAFAQGGQLQLSEEAIVEATRMCENAWNKTLGNPQKADDMSDSIPW